MRQRLALAQALVNNPDLVVLDEPTDGLDPIGRKETRDVLGQLRAQGKTVFLNSHLLGDVEQLCDRVAILVQGQVVRQGTISDLTAGSVRYVIDVAAADPVAARAALRGALPCQWVVRAQAAEGQPAGSGAVETGRLASGETVELAGTNLHVFTGEPARVQPVLDALRAAGLVIHELRLVRQSLEDYFMQAVSTADGGLGGGAVPQKSGQSPRGGRT
jgi:ABC-2 type transport system ATP-binding protein